MLERVIEFSARNRIMTLLLVGLCVVAGIRAIDQVPLDAIPDLSDTQVIVYSEWNVSPDIIEDQITYPIITSLLGVPGVKDIRGLSTFGASFVYVIFEDGTDLYWARSRVLEYLSNITKNLPEGATTQLGPDATGVGWVYQYAIKDVSGKHSLADLRSLQDWFLRYQLQSVPGISEVASFGGYEKQFQVQVNPESLRAFKVPLSQLTSAIRKGNNETGARVIELGGAEFMLRLKGYANSKEDIESIVVSVSPQGVPVYVKNLAKVVSGPEMRRGVGDLDGLGDTVGGIVVMRDGENAEAVISAVKRKLQSLKNSLPEGVEIVETYDRSDLIKRAVKTLTGELIVEMIVVSLIIIIFLQHVPSAFVPIITLPAAVIIAFVLIDLFGISANIMSLGGIAIAIGAMVDASIVVVENVHKKLAQWHSDGERQPLPEVVVSAVREVGPASFYSLLVIAACFLPLFTLEAQEGRLFKPLAYTKAFSMMVAAFLSITLVPALLMLIIRPLSLKKGPDFLTGPFNRIFKLPTRQENEHVISRVLQRLYGPCVSFVVHHRLKVIIAAILMFLGSLPVFMKLGTEFMPPLNEGTILYMPTTMPGITIGKARDLLQLQDQMLKSFPEVKSVHGKAGRANTATDPAPLSMMETVVVLKPQSEWRQVERFYDHWPTPFPQLFGFFDAKTISYEELISTMNRKMQIPGLTNAWTMPIKGRIDMLTTGIRTPVGIKVSGAKIEEIEKIGIALEAIANQTPGTRSAFAERVAGGFFMDIEFDRAALARHGISIADAHASIATAVGGQNVTQTVDGRERYAINVRYARAFRQTKEDIGKVLIGTPHGHQVPLIDVAGITLQSGPGMIRNDNGLLTGYVFVDTDESDIATYVERLKGEVEAKFKLPAGYSLAYSGQYESIRRVQDKLKVVLPLTLVLVILLIYLNTRSGMKTAIVLLAIPFSAIGAIWLLYILGYHMSIAVWVGIIALVGVDTETAIFMLLYLDLAWKKRKDEGRLKTMDDLKEAIHEGAVMRIRPKMMTVLTTFFALIPIMWASSSMAGADVMKRLVAPMVGGIFTSFLLELLVYPAIFAVWKSRELKS
jgi:Cu(I)/Ag(I) efflux system membrane protein CusA/SilA